MDPHIATHALASAARELGARIETGRRVTGIRLGQSGEVDSRRNRRRADRDRARRERLRDVGAAGLRDGRGVHALGAGRPPAHRARGGGRARAPTRDALLPRPRQSRLRQVGGGRDPLRRLRAQPGRALGRRRSVGPRGHAGPAGPRALRPAHGRRRAALPLPARRGRRRPHLPSRRDDAGRQSAPRADARRARFLDGRRALAQRLRRRWRPRQDDRRVDHRRRDRARRDRLPRLALRRRLPGSHFARDTAREVYRYYYRLRYPFDVDEWGRPKRLSPLHERLEDLGAVFGTKNGWERADFFEPGRRAAGPVPTSARSDSRSPPGSSGSGWSTRPSASVSASST